MSDEVKYSCGHIAPRTQAYQSWHKCPDCHRSADSAAIRNKEAGLPPLKGADKQIHWAESIRDKANRTLTKYMMQWREISIPHANLIQSRIAKKICELLNEENAAWWIQNKDADWACCVISGILK